MAERFEGLGVGSTQDYDAAPIHRRVLAQAQLTPDAIALLHGDERLTYAQLDARSAAVASCLQQQGIAAGRIVALKLHRGFAQIVALLGCLRAGCVYLSIDPFFPEPRIAQIMEDAAPVALFVDDADDVTARGWRGRTKIILPAEISTAAANVQPPDINPDDPMYVIYTSGTTGRPKGIVQTHRTITNLIDWQNRASGIDATGCVLQFSSLGFDVHLQELFSALSCGGSVCLIDQADRTDPERLLELVRRQRVSVMFLPVQMLTVAIEASAGLSELITDIITAGEQLVITPALNALLASRPALRLHNHYGVSESHVVTALTLCGEQNGQEKPSVGWPIQNCKLRILDESGRACEQGVIGELWIGGDCLAQGYLNLPERTAETFTTGDDGRWYRTGDFGAWREDGAIDFKGRQDDQVKIDGSLVRLGDVEATVQTHPAVVQCAIVAIEAGEGRRLVCHAVVNVPVAAGELRDHVAGLLPTFMVPSQFLFADTLPIGPTGKVDRSRLSRTAIDREMLQVPYTRPASLIEQQVVGVIADALGIVDLGMDDPFALVGMTSLGTLRAAAALSKLLNQRVPPTLFYEHVTARQLAGSLNDRTSANAAGAAVSPRRAAAAGSAAPVAIIGMAGLFPGATSVDELWRNIMAGADLLSDSEPPVGVHEELEPRSGQAVPRAGTIGNLYGFDAKLFGIRPNEATWIDPQQRKFLEQAWTCLEDAGIDPARIDARIGVFAGSAESAHLFRVAPMVDDTVDYLAAVVGSDKDFIATRVAYHLGLTGPAVNVQSACSTGLLAVHHAVRALQAGDCDVAIAGAASILPSQTRALPFVPGGILSADGETRTFDRNRGGTNLTSGVAAVCLKLLDDAVRDGDAIRAVIRGSGINNDGARKSGYAAPSVAGQSEAIIDAMLAANASPDEIAFVETHGTATALGDQVELEALDRAYSALGSASGAIQLSAVKSWVGHTNRAAGVVGLIAAVRSLEGDTVAGIRNYTTADPELYLLGDRFAASGLPCAIGERPGRTLAGISSFGIGGTNVHIVIEKYIAPTEKRSVADGPSLCVLSAQTPDALAAGAARLAAHLDRQPAAVVDVAHTLAQGRRQLPVRVAMVAADHGALQSALARAADKQGFAVADHQPPTAFIVPGSGVQYAAMGRGLYATDAVFRSEILAGAALLKARCGLDLAPWFTTRAALNIAEMAIVHPLLLLIEIAVGRALAAKAMVPSLMLGLSGGEFACAVLAGCMEQGAALEAVHIRGRLMDQSEIRGLAATVSLSADDVAAYLAPGVFMAGVNTRRHTLLAGETENMLRLFARLDADGVDYRRLSNAVPNHTPLMEPLAAQFRGVIEAMTLLPPTMPFVSGVTGTIATAAMVTDPDYWTNHLCAPILFARGLETLESQGVQFFAEIGPRDTMCQFGRAHLPGRPDLVFAPALPRDEEATGFLTLLGSWWTRGGALDFAAIAPDAGGRKLSLPGYAFSTDLCLPTSAQARNATPSPSPSQTRAAWAPLPRSQWLHRRTLRRIAAPMTAEVEDVQTGKTGWLVVGSGPLAQEVARTLKATLTTAQAELDKAAAGLQGAIFIAEKDDPVVNLLAAASLLTGSFAEEGARVLLVTVSHGEDPIPDAAFATAAETARLELPHLWCRHLLLDPTHRVAQQAEQIVDHLADERRDLPVIVRRGRHSLAEAFVPVGQAFAEYSADAARGTVWLLAGGSGPVGLSFAEALAARGATAVMILGRRSADGEDAAAMRLRQRIGALDTRETIVEYLCADITDATAVQHALTTVQERFGRIDFVVHMAAATEGDRFLSFLADLSAETIDTQMQGKVTGLAVLDGALHNLPVMPRRFAFSSVSVLLSGLAYAAYTFANRRLLEECLITPGWQIVHWDVWDVAMDEAGVIGSTARDSAMAPAAAVDILLALAAGDDQEVAVLIDPVDARLARAATAMVRTPPGDASATAADPSDWINVVRDVWKGRLGVAELPDDANFLQYGGDSLAAIRVALDLRSRLHRPVESALLIRHPLLTDFVAAIRLLPAQEQENATSAKAEESGDGKGAYLASPLQQRWHRMHPLGFGNLVMPVVLTGVVDIERLAACVGTALRQFEALRTVYHSRGTTTYAEPLAPEAIADPTIVALDGIAEHERSAWLADWAASIEHGQLPLDRPPLACHIVAYSPTETLIVIQVHHICFDGWSASVLLDTVGELYRGGTNIADGAFRPISAWSWRFLQSPQADGLRERWRGALASPPDPCRPRADCDGASDALHARKRHFILSPAETLCLRDAGARAGATLFATLLAGFALFLSEASGERDLLFGTTGTGRMAPGAEEAVGVFVNPLPLRVLVDEGDSREDLVRKMAMIMDLFHASQCYPLVDLVETVPEVGTRGLNGVFSSYILYQNYRQPVPWPGLNVDFGEPDDTMDASLLAAFNASEVRLMRDFEVIIFDRPDGGLSVNMWYRSALYSEARADALCHALKTHLLP